MAEGAVQQVPAEEPKAEPVEAAVPPADGQTPPTEQKPEPAKVFTQEEVDRITAKVKKNAAYRARKEAEAYWKGLQQGATVANPAAAQPAAKPAEPRAPERGDFDSYEAFLEAKAAHVARKAATEDRTRYDEEVKARAAAEVKAKALATFQAKTREKFPDIEDRMEAIGHIVMPEGMGEAIAESDLGPEILDFFASNPKDCERIAALSPSAALREIGKLEAKLEAPAPKPSPKPASKAPEPIKPGGVASAPPDDVPTDKDSIDEWMRKENARMRKRYG